MYDAGRTLLYAVVLLTVSDYFKYHEKAPYDENDEYEMEFEQFFHSIDRYEWYCKLKNYVEKNGG